MKRLGKSKLFGLLIFLSVALVFVGGNFLEGQKGKRPPGDRVRVIIPTSEEGYNLFGIGIEEDGFYYDDDTYVFAGGNKGLRKNPAYPYYVFELTLCNAKSWGDSCTQADEYPIPGDYTVGFQNISINPDSVWNPDEGRTCLFPPPACWGGQEPDCMACFLNNREHPSSWECVDGENRCYMGAYIKIKVFDEIWNYPINDNVATPAQISLYISVYTGIMAYEGEDFYHDIEIHKPENVTYWANVTRLDEDSWKIVFNRDSLQDQPGLVEFRETHNVLLGEVKPKGKSGEYHYEYEERTTMIATADHFSFEITWESY